jgi:glycerol uptake operon antiterminator
MSAPFSGLIGRIEANPIIAAVRRDGDVEDALSASVGIVFLLQADIFNLAGLTERFRSAGKEVLVHVDFLEGIGRDAKAVRYLAEVIRPSGILTTKSQHVKTAKEYGLFVIQRFFLIDHQSYEMAVHTVHSSHPDMVELMPALMPAVIARFCKAVSTPVIAGGLISSKEEIVEILKAGALGASTGNPLLWNI